MPFEPNLTNAKFKRWGSEDKTRKTDAQIFLDAVKVKGSDGILFFFLLSDVHIEIWENLNTKA